MTLLGAVLDTGIFIRNKKDLSQASWSFLGEERFKKKKNKKMEKN